MKNIIAIVGPTGVGKTKLSVELAKKINAEIINADSCQIYKGMNIGTAKIKEEEKDGVIHHLFDIVEPSVNYTVFDYQKDARKLIDDIEKRGKRVLFVGGTGLYLKACLYQYEFQKEEKEYSFPNYTNEELYQILQKENIKIDVHKNNRKRLERLVTKLWNNSILDKKGEVPLYNFTIIGLKTDREKLYSIINDRVDKMMIEGLEEEVFNFYKKKIQSKAMMTAIGYKELYKYFDGDYKKQEAIDKIKQNSRKYAKKQFTFFNHQLPVNWFTTNYENFDKTIDEVYNFLLKEEK